jgi:N-acyl homoserine lactone hydrolase
LANFGLSRSIARGEIVLPQFSRRLIKLYLLQLGLLQPLSIPVPGYLIQTDDGKNVLIDTGFPYSFIEEPPGPQPPLNLLLEMLPEDYVLNRLRSIGLQAADIHFLICSHFDPDHAGNHELFSNAELVVQRSHYEVARSGRARYEVVCEHWDTPSLHYRLVDRDITLLPGIDLLETSGHVPGHQSVLISLIQTGPVLLTIDAIPSASMLDSETRVVFPDNDEDEAKTRASTRKLVEIAQLVGAFIIHGHDHQQWPKLKHAPEYYT